MSSVRVEIGGKGIGIADQASIDLRRGCNNKCTGCYAAKTSRLGNKFYDTQVVKEFDDVEFSKSCRSVLKRDIRYARFGKHTDNGDPTLREQCYGVIQKSTECGLRLVFVSKSLTYDRELSKKLIDGGHTLHMSLGMLTEAQSNEDRFETYQRYAQDGVNAVLRITEDVTKPLPSSYSDMNIEDHLDNIIVTPMRFASKDLALISYGIGAGIKDYTFTGGFYRPNFIHESWDSIKNFCGEVADQIFCSNCLVI